MFDPCIIDEFQGTDSHDCVKCTSEMRDALVTHVCKQFYGELLRIIVVYVVEGRVD